jgi:ATP-binding cassette subfamily B protein RaxB
MSLISKLLFSGKSAIPVIIQTEYAECGLACLAMCSAYYGRPIPLSTLRAKYQVGLKGMDLGTVVDIASDLGLSSRPMRCELGQINTLVLPAVLHWEMEHFVVLTNVRNNKFTIYDPAVGKRVFTQQQLAKHYTGIAMELEPANNFDEITPTAKFELRQLWSDLSGFKRSLIQLFALSAIIQVLLLLAPYYVQTIVDEVVVTADLALLNVLAIGFSLLILVKVIIELVRDWFILRLSSTLNLQLGNNVFGQLLRLPVQFFQARHAGDIVSRFESLDYIRERLTTGLVTALIDGVMSLTLLLVLFLYSSYLGLLVSCFIIVYLSIRLSLYNKLYRENQELLINSAKEYSHFLESVRSIQTIKLFGNESLRQTVWSNKYVDVVNSSIKVGRLEIGFETAQRAIFGFENIIIIFIAAHLVLDDVFTVGMLIAFLFYKQQLIEKVSNFIKELIEFKLMRLHLDRLSDVVTAQKEKNLDGIGLQKRPSGKLELKRIRFRYAPHEPFILDDVSMTINAGESVAIVGGSGSGKSTLIKIMLGLLEPTEGQVLLDGKDIRHIGLKNYRKAIAAVMQDDILLDGSIADNISAFKHGASHDDIATYANYAQIHSEIESMPMGYFSTVGDMGSTLSGGQIQRILLARAFFKKPAILFLDEATSNLDIINEHDINKHIRKMNVSRIMVAHRPETIKLADSVISLVDGKLLQDSGDSILKANLNR